MKRMKINDCPLCNDWKEDFFFNDEDGIYYNLSLGMSVNSWNGEVNFEDLFYIIEYEDFYKKLTRLLEYINSLPSYYFDFGERVNNYEVKN